MQIQMTSPPPPPPVNFLVPSPTISSSSPPPPSRYFTSLSNSYLHHPSLLSTYPHVFCHLIKNRIIAQKRHLSTFLTSRLSFFFPRLLLQGLFLACIFFLSFALFFFPPIILLFPILFFVPNLILLFPPQIPVIFLTS